MLESVAGVTVTSNEELPVNQLMVKLMHLCATNPGARSDSELEFRLRGVRFEGVHRTSYHVSVVGCTNLHQEDSSRNSRKQKVQASVFME